MNARIKALWAVVAAAASASIADASKLRKVKAEFPPGYADNLRQVELEAELEGVISLSSGIKANNTGLDPSAVEKMEKAVTDLVTNVGAKTPMGNSVRQIKGLITKTMQPKVLKAHKQDSEALRNMVNDGVKCSSTRDVEERVADVQNAEYRRTSPLHKMCRMQEATFFTEASDCEKRISSAKSIRDLSCQASEAYAKTWGQTAKNTAIVEKGAGESPDIYMKRLHDTYCGGTGLSDKGFYEKYQDTKGACQKAEDSFKGLADGCTRKSERYKAKVAECDNIQSQMDGAACNRAVLVKDSCESYAGCYANNRVAFLNAKALAKSAEKDRKGEWRALKRMLCLIDSFADKSVQNSEITKCKKMTHDTSHLDMNFGDYTLQEARSCVVPNNYPATAAYKKAEFAPLPALAKGKADAHECYGVLEISTKPKAGSPPSCKCERVTLNGPYSAGAMVKCTGCNDVYRATEKDSCPEGTKIFSPRSRSDWQTIIASVAPLRAPNWIVDVTRAENGCPGCAQSKAFDGTRQSWVTRDGSPWWLRDTVYRQFDENAHDYQANCYLEITSRSLTDANNLEFASSSSCGAHSSSYFCQQKMISTKPKVGSPAGCQCTRVELTGRYSAGALLKCVGCNRVTGANDKDSCPEGTKLFSPRSREDWKTIIDSAGPLRSPNWIVDVTRAEDGCAGCVKAAMNSDVPEQASWTTQDGSPWWLRSTKYSEPNGDYTANCYMDLWKNPNNADSITFNDGKCKYGSDAYYCQPRQIYAR